MFDALLSVTLLVMVVLLAFAWVDGGSYWAWFSAGVAAHVGIFAVEINLRAPIAYDQDRYYQNAKRNLAIFIVILLLAAGLICFLV